MSPSPTAAAGATSRCSRSIARASPGRRATSCGRRTEHPELLGRVRVELVAVPPGVRIGNINTDSDYRRLLRDPSPFDFGRPPG